MSRMTEEMVTDGKVRSPQGIFTTRRIILMILVVVVGVVGGLIGWAIGKGQVHPTSSNGATTGSPTNSPTTDLQEIHKQIIAEMKSTNIEDLLKYLSAKPHIAASARQLELANFIKSKWEEYNFDKVELVKYKVLLSKPQTVLKNRVGLKDSSDVFRYEATIKEKVLHPDEDDPNIVLPFNAYAKEATVEGDLIYVNYARQEDFVKLENDFQLNCDNKIAIARYGKIFRGDKARIAERFRCKGLILFSDPADYAPPGYKKYPDGWFLPDTGVQRGTLFLGDGDPQTPGYPAIESAYRWPLENLTDVLPNIPVQPLSASDAAPLLQAMSGNEVPAEWRGQLQNTTYRFGGQFTGSRNGWKAYLEVHNTRESLDAYNVIGTINGKLDPDHYVLVGNHRDSWIFGAVDPSSGTSNMMEISRAITTVMKKTGWRPRRTIKFCSWGAEEYGLIGSTEWVEENEKLLIRNAVSYANTDIAAEGNFTLHAAASPIMKSVLYEAAKQTPDPDDSTKSLYDTWLQRKPSADKSEPYVGSLGAGSDYAPFMQRVGVSSVDFSYDFDTGYYPVSSYPAYHTIYDTFDYVKKTIDPDFRYHLAGARVCCSLTLLQADNPVLSMSAPEYAKTLKLYFDQLAEQYEARLNARNIKLNYLRSAINNFTTAAQTFDSFAKSIKSDQPWVRRAANNRLIQLDKMFVNPAGLPGRPLKKHILFAPSMFNTYGGAKFPGITDSYFLATTNGNWGEVEKQVSIAAFYVQAAAKSLSFTP